jgi:hypothetical protein
MKRSAYDQLKLLLVFAVLVGWSACGGPPPEEPEEKPPSQAVVVEPPAPPPVNKEELLADYANQIHTDLDLVKREAEKGGLVEKIGQKQISPDEFARFTSFFWAVDPGLRMSQLQAMIHFNRLLEVLKPAESAALDPAAPPSSASPSADPDQDNVSFLISQVIADTAQVQGKIVAGVKTLGIKNVKAVLPTDEFAPATAMMQELSALLNPGGTPVPETLKAPGGGPLPESKPETLKGNTQGGILRMILGEAYAQTAAPNKRRASTAGKTTPAALTAAPMKMLGPPLPKVGTITAPQLLARTLAYNIDGKTYVLRSPFGKAAAEFHAIPAESYIFKVEKQTIGRLYRDAVETRLQALAALQSRNVPQWWETASALTELKLANQLVDLSKPSESMPESAPTSLPSTQPAPLSFQQPISESKPAGALTPPAPPPGSPPAAPESAPAPGPTPP